jgi:hypothetical protein
MAPERLILWIAFNVFVLGMLALDLDIFHRKAHAVSIKEASIWSAVWILLALIFNLGTILFWDKRKLSNFSPATLSRNPLASTIFSFFS